MENQSSNNGSSTTELQITEKQDVQVVSYFGNKDLFEHVQRVAKVFSQSDLVPKRYNNNIGNCVIALEMANRIGASPLMVMQNLDVILGKPSWSSKFLIASINACGKFSPLRYEEDEQNGGRTRAWAFDKANNEKIYGAWVSMEMAKSEGWIDKNGSKWKTMPELMRRYRAASFFVNQFAPEISMGLASSEEVYDITPAQPTQASSVDKETERLIALINDCKTIEELQVLLVHVKPEQREIYDAKMEELSRPVSVDEIPTEISFEIEAAETIVNLSAIEASYPALKGNKFFTNAINAKKIAIGKLLKSKTK